MLIEADEPCPLPSDPLLAEWAAALRNTRDWGWILDAQWRIVYITDEQRISFSAGVGMVPVVLDAHVFGPEMVRVSADWRTGPTVEVSWRELFAVTGGMILADTPGGKTQLASIVDPTLAALVDDLSPSPGSAASGQVTSTATVGDRRPPVDVKVVRIRDSNGEHRGAMMLWKPSIGMDSLGAMAFERDLGHVERLRTVAQARRRPAAILFGDLEGSSKLARSLSTSSYFGAVRRIVRAADQCVVRAGGVVGRHVGDGVVAFFPVEVFDSESAAARACVSAARQMVAAMHDVADRCALPAEDLTMRFGLHWGSTVFVGNISTLARSEVTALGDEVNEAARIEACATGGRILASKPLIERLNDDDAPALEIDPDHLTYTQLADLTTATDKARRDAPAVSVCEIPDQ
jgi:class 3 adenylate cyclase